jgi:hypothetical protein
LRRILGQLVRHGVGSPCFSGWLGRLGARRQVLAEIEVAIAQTLEHRLVLHLHLLLNHFIRLVRRVLHAAGREDRALEE